MRPTQSWCPEPAGGGPSLPSTPPRPPSALPERQKRLRALTSTSPPPATQTSGGYYSAAHAAKRHFHNETSHFFFALSRSQILPHGSSSMRLSRLPRPSGCSSRLYGGSGVAGVPSVFRPAHRRRHGGFPERRQRSAAYVCLHPCVTSPP